MKLTYEVHCKALIGHKVDGHAGYGCGKFSTNARTVDGLLRRMEKEARAAFDKRIKFYDEYRSARKFDVFDEDHVWHFSTSARTSTGKVVRFDAFAIKHDGNYSPVMFATYGAKNTAEEWLAYKTTCDRYANMVA